MKKPVNIEPRRYFFIERKDIHGDYLTLKDSEAKHAISVLRMQKGSKLVAVDGQGREYKARIVNYFKNIVECKIESILEKPADVISVILAQGIIKGNRMDFLVEKVCELGILKIVPMITERTVARPGADKIIRWRRISESALKQSHGTKQTLISEPESFSSLISVNNFHKEKILVSPESTCFLEDEFIISTLQKQIPLNIFVGPEGGFSAEEIEYARQNNVKIYSIGRRCFRAETASIMMVTILHYLIMKEQEKRN